MAKLSNDYNRLILTINSSQAQKEINSLSESTKELEKRVPFRTHIADYIKQS
jgi:hypothetical protein